ncbi:MAG: 50S ribosomal protein L29 [Candidatus Sungbacteria bacterium]|uniref:Large ribosomal subunit protein uL29 n=1 Tax=Candidatus Sungiibacteriota bacterium TaxID=2750080 RepID=A0A932DS89_9BACT|nr:50S ribosomal protein L29 [Candidatus Sungbacteria bacterium]MBI2465657.1 50S ribosomal protein L29 [Candidatus Sungbacteria bacterium]
MSKLNDLRSRTKEDLEKMLGEERTKLRELNFKLVGSQLKNVSDFGKTKHTIAVLLTILREKI